MCQVEDNHLFGEDSEIAEGATEKMITGWAGRENVLVWSLCICFNFL